MSTRVVLMLALAGWCVLGAANAFALSIKPNDADLADLDHNYYYTWGINVQPTSERIVSAQLFIDNIYDWTTERNDILYVHLLDNVPYSPLRQPGNKPSSRVTQGTDFEIPHDAFAGQGRLLFTYTDKVGGLPSEDVTYTFTADDLALLNTYWKNDGANRGVFGFGLDPDCHYYNDGITFTCEFGHDPVPEPASLLLLSIGAVGAFFRRRFYA